VSPTVRVAIWCNSRLARVAYRYAGSVVLLCAILMAAAGLTFIAHALRNNHLTWGMRLWWATALLLFSPIMAPAYWMIHLRRP